MDDLKKDEQMTSLFSNALAKPLSRKDFLKWTGVSAAVMGFGISLNGCKSDTVVNPVGGINLTADDFGVLNYAYALEQLEAAFYAKVISSFYSGASDYEKSVLNDIAVHEAIHRDFFKTAIPAANRITDGMAFNLSSIDFTSRASVLGAAKAFEDTGVMAYNGAGYYITNADYLTVAGKIVSVEARHSAAIRDLLNPKSADFAGDDVITSSNGLEKSAKPSVVIPIVAPYFTVAVTSSLP